MATIKNYPTSELRMRVTRIFRTAENTTEKALWEVPERKQGDYPRSIRSTFRTGYPHVRGSISLSTPPIQSTWWDRSEIPRTVQLTQGLISWGALFMRHFRTDKTLFERVTLTLWISCFTSSWTSLSSKGSILHDDFFPQSFQSNIQTIRQPHLHRTKSVDFYSEDHPACGSINLVGRSTGVTRARKDDD